MTSISRDTDHTQDDHTRPAAAPAARATAKPRFARAYRKPRRLPVENPAELEQVLDVTEQKIRHAETTEKSGVRLWKAIGQALREGTLQLQTSEKVRFYGCRYIEQVAERCDIHHRILHLCAQLVAALNDTQIGRLATADLPWRVTRDAVAYITDGEDRGKRLQALMAHIPKSNASVARSAFTKWLKEECLKRNPLTVAHRWVIVDAGGYINGKVMTGERARALAHGRRIMQVKPPVK